MQIINDTFAMTVSTTFYNFFYFSLIYRCMVFVIYIYIFLYIFTIFF